MKFTYRPKGVCSQLMEIEIEEGRLTGLKVMGGCDGNLQSICRLVTGQKIDDVIPKLNGIRCGGKPTSCPDQLCRALETLKK